MCFTPNDFCRTSFHLDNANFLILDKLKFFCKDHKLNAMDNHKIVNGIMLTFLFTVLLIRLLLSRTTNRGLLIPFGLDYYCYFENKPLLMIASIHETKLFCTINLPIFIEKKRKYLNSIPLPIQIAALRTLLSPRPNNSIFFNFRYCFS